MPVYRLVTPSGSIPLAAAELHLGSSPDCQVRAEGPEVASHHARIIVRADAPPLVEPLSPSCAVFIDGRAVADRAELRPGSVLRAGLSEFTLEMSQAAPAAAKRRPLWKRLLRGTAYAAGALLALVLLIIVLVPFILSEARVKQTIKEALEKSLRRDVSIGGVDLRLLRGLTIRDLRVENKEGFNHDQPFLTVKEVDVRVDVGALLWSRFHDLRATATVKSPAVYVEREAAHGKLNIADLLEGGADAPGSAGAAGAAGGGGGADKKSGSSAGPLGPLERLGCNLEVESGSLLFKDHQGKTEGRVQGFNLKARLADCSVPEMAGKLSYELAMSAPHAGHAGSVSLKGAADFDLDQAAGRNALGCEIKRLAGELLAADVKDLDLGGFAGWLPMRSPGPATLALSVKAVSAETVELKGRLDVPQLDAVALGLSDKPAPGVGAQVDLQGRANLKTGTAQLRLAGVSPLWQTLSASLEVTDLPALALAASGPPASAAGAVKLNLRAEADIGRLTGGEVGRLFGAQDRIDGTLIVSVEAEGRAADLPIDEKNAFVELRGLKVPKAYTGNVELPPEDITVRLGGRLDLDPVTLAFRKGAFTAKIKSAAVDGELTDGLIVAAGRDQSGRFGGTLTLKANFKKIVDRYGRILPALPELDEDLTLTASARGESGPIEVRAELETRRAGAPAAPDPLKVAAAATVELSPAPKGQPAPVNLRKLSLKAWTPESPMLSLQAAGQVLNAFADPDFDLTFEQKADLAALWARLAPVFKRPKGGKWGELAVRGQLAVTGGELKGRRAALANKFTLEITGLELAGGELRGPIKEARLRADVNSVLKMPVDGFGLNANTVTVASSFCNLSVSGEALLVEPPAEFRSVPVWLLKGFKLTLDADAGKTADLLRQFVQAFPPNLKPGGRIALALSGDQAARTVSLERLLVDTDLVKVRAAGSLKDFQADKAASPDEKERAEAWDAATVELNVEECRTDILTLGQFRDFFPQVPAELVGLGPVSLTARLAGSGSRLNLAATLEASDAAVALPGLVIKPARTPATVKLSGALDPGGKDKALKLSALDIRLGELAVSGSGAAALDLSAVEANLKVAAFAPESVRALLPALADFAFGGKAELESLHVEGSLKAVLESRQAVFAGRLAGLRFSGKARVEDAALEYRALPHMRLRADGAVLLDTQSLQIDGLSVGVVHKRTQQESRLIVKKGRVTSATEKGGLLADLGRLAADVEVSSPEIKVHEVLLAIEAPVSAPAARGAGAAASPAPAGESGPLPPRPPAAGKPYEFLAGYRLTGRIEIGKVSYLNYALTDLAGSMNFRDNAGKVSDFKARAYQGEVSGWVAADLNVPGIANAGEVKLANVDLNTAATEILASKDIFNGRASGAVAWKAVGVKPGEFEALDGTVRLRYEDAVVRNIEKFPPLRESVGALGRAFLPALVRELNLSEFRLSPAEVALALEPADRKPAVRARDQAVFRTLDADPLEVGLLGGAVLFPDEKGEFPFLKDTRLYFRRFPESWLARVDVGALSPGIGGEAAGKKIREVIARGAANGKIYQEFSGTIQSPQVNKEDFLKSIAGLVKEIKFKDVLDVGLDILKKKAEESVPAPAPAPGPKPAEDPKKKSNPLEDLLKKKLKL